MRVSPRIRKWLTGPKSDPSVRVRYWTEVEGRDHRDAEVQKALKSIGRSGWAASLLQYQLPQGQWTTPGTSVPELLRPRYIATNWQAIVLSDLGMTRSDPRIQKTAERILSWRQEVLKANDAELCFAGNATRTLIQFGYLDHPVVQQWIAWLVRNQKSDGGWHCFPFRSGTLDAWEGLAALAEIPEDSRDDSVRRAIDRGAEFYLKRKLMHQGAAGYAPWFRIHYPNHFYYDLLVGLRILTRLGHGGDPRLAPALRWLRAKRARDGTWALDAAHPDLNEADAYLFRQPVFPLMLEAPLAPSQWATVEALSILTRAESDSTATTGPST
jgi:hypothetical protein